MVRDTPFFWASCKNSLQPERSADGDVSMSAIDVKEIVYHCQCRRFAEETPVAPARCPECRWEYVPNEDTLISGPGAPGVQTEAA
jgi:hypothetical protein